MDYSLLYTVRIGSTTKHLFIEQRAETFALHSFFYARTFRFRFRQRFRLHVREKSSNKHERNVREQDSREKKQSVRCLTNYSLSGIGSNFLECLGMFISVSASVMS